MLEEKIKKITELNIEDVMLKHYLNSDIKKYNKNCQMILV